MRKISLFLLLAMLIQSCGISAQKASLSGTIADLPADAKVVLTKVAGDQILPVDTLKLDNNGAFKVALTLDQPTLYLLHATSERNSFCHLMVEPKEKIQLDMIYVADRKTFKITHCKGSKNVDLYRQFNDILLGAVNSTTQALVPSQVENLLLQNKQVLMSAFLSTFFEQEFDAHVTLYVQLRDALLPEYPNDQFVKRLAERLKGVVAPGMVAPDIEMKDPDGNVRRLSDLRGKVVLLDFWASWCGPCRHENPNVVRLYNKYHDKGFEIYSVSLDKSREAWVKAIKDDHLSWPNHVSDLQGWTSTGGKTYGIMSVPSTVLIDKDGTVIARNLRGEELERKLNEIFN